MTAQEKAKAGIWLLKQAVLEFLAEHPEGVRPEAIRDALHLHDETDAKNHRGRLLWGIEFLLKQDGRLRTEKIDGLNHLVLIQETEG